MKLKKWLALGLVGASMLVCSSCAVKFDYPIESKAVTGEQVANAQEWDQAFRAANMLAEKEGVSYTMVVHVSEGKSFANGAFSMNTNVFGYKSTGILEGKESGKLSFTYNVYTSKVAIRMMDLGTTYREMKGDKAVEIAQNADGTYSGSDIGTDLLADAIPISWTLFSVGDDVGEAGYDYENATFLPEENCYYEEFTEGELTQKNWIWIVDGVVRKFRTESKIYAQKNSSFAIQEETYEIYVGGMNGTVEIPSYTYDGFI